VCGNSSLKWNVPPLYGLSDYTKTPHGVSARIGEIWVATEANRGLDRTLPFKEVFFEGFNFYAL
jgi:hypothetical protein